MIQMLFSLRFQAQLRRTRPELYTRIEKSVMSAIKAAGGSAGYERRSIAASFDEQAIGFWLSILTLLETILKVTGATAAELYGHIILLGENLQDGDGLKLIRALPSGGTGIWCGPAVQQALAPYAAFYQPLSPDDGPILFPEYVRIKNFISPAVKNPPRLFPYRARIRELINPGSSRNVALVGPRFIGKRDGLRRIFEEFQRDVPPLIITFGAGGSGLPCFADAVTPVIRAFLTPFIGNEAVEELDALGEGIVRERFREQYSDYLIHKSKQFARKLFEAYRKAAEGRSAKPVVIVENLDQADFEAGQLFIGLYQKPSIKDNFLIYGTSAGGSLASAGGQGENSALGPWAAVFPRILQIPAEGYAPLPPPALPPDLWEIAYAVCLFRRFFPAHLYLSLFQEAGLNPQMISRAMDFFILMGLIDFREDPQPRMPGFIAKAELMLGKRKDIVRAMVWVRILSLVNKGTIMPCFNVLKVLSQLGGEGSDSLFLNAILADIVNKTCRGIDDAIGSRQFGIIVGERRFAQLLYIFKTFKALIHGGEREIREAFLAPLPDTGAFPVYHAQIQANLAGYHLGIQDIAAAADSVKAAMLFSQNLTEGKGLAQAYRLFSLVNLSRQRMEDSIDYFVFALEHAQRSGNKEELAVTAYYAAAAHLLFGNIFKAGQLALQAEEAAFSSGRPEWAYRSRFLLGRIRFETGLYQEAQDIFAGLGEQISYTGSANRDMILAAWIYRTDVYLFGPKPRKPEKMNSDALLFEIEAAYFAGDYEQTLALADGFAQKLPDRGFVFIEQPDWRSGFSQGELLLFPAQDFYFRILACYRALALAQLGKYNNASRSLALEGMWRILRDERLPDTDPNDAFYFYSYYCVLEETGALEVDMNTAVSMAFKHLQSRASHITDMETKRSFLSLHYWNNALQKAAKKHNLI